AHAFGRPPTEGLNRPEGNSPTVSASDLAVASNARRGSRPMAEHRVMSEHFLDVTHYRSKRCYESHAMEQKTGARAAMPPGHPARRGHEAVAASLAGWIPSRRTRTAPARGRGRLVPGAPAARPDRDGAQRDPAG